MSPDKDAELCAKYPQIFANRHGDMRSTCMCWGLECGDGWFDLIDTLCGLLQWDTDHNGQPQIVASQVKEKYGTLRFYTEGSTERQDGAIAMAEQMSGRLCERCGGPSRVSGTGWLSTVCKLCNPPTAGDKHGQT